MSSLKDKLDNLKDLNLTYEEIKEGVIPNVDSYTVKEAKKINEDKFVPKKLVDFVVGSYASDLSEVVESHEELEEKIIEASNKLVELADVLEQQKVLGYDVDSDIKSLESIHVDTQEKLKEIAEKRKNDQVKIKKLEQSNENLELKIEDFKKEIAKLIEDKEKLSNDMTDLTTLKRDFENVQSQNDILMSDIEKFADIDDSTVALIRRLTPEQLGVLKALEDLSVLTILRDVNPEYIQFMKDDNTYIDRLWEEYEASLTENDQLADDINDIIDSLKSSFEKHGMEFSSDILLPKSETTDEEE